MPKRPPWHEVRHDYLANHAATNDGWKKPLVAAAFPPSCAGFKRRAREALKACGVTVRPEDTFLHTPVAQAMWEAMFLGMEILASDLERSIEIVDFLVENSKDEISKKFLIAQSASLRKTRTRIRGHYLHLQYRAQYRRPVSGNAQRRLQKKREATK